MVENMTSVSVIGIYVDNIKEAVEFYCDQLGFKIQNQYNDGCIVMLENDGPTLILEQVEQKAEKKVPGSSQIVICIATNDIVTRSKELRKLGVKFVFDEPKPFTAGKYMIMNDPAGNIVELLEFDEE